MPYGLVTTVERSEMTNSWFTKTRVPAILVAATLLSAACGSGATTAPGSAAAPASSAPASAAASAVAPASSAPASAAASAASAVPGASTSAANPHDQNFKVALVIPGTLGDKGFFDSANAGVMRAAQDFGIQTKVLQASPTDPSQWLQNLQSVSDGSYNLVITGSTQQHDNLTQVAKQHPNQHYIQFDDQVALANVLSIEYKQNDGSYLAGVLAGIVATDKTDFKLSSGGGKIGLVGGMNIPVINDFVDGYKQGAESVGIKPSNILVSYIGNFNDANKAYNLTQAMYDQGADIVFAVAGGAGLGVLKASSQANKYSIGVDSNQNNLYPGHVLASMVKEVGNSLYDQIKAAILGNAPWGTLLHYGLPQKGVGLIIDTQDVPQSVVDKLNAAEQDVASGKVTVQSAFSQ